MMTEKTNMFLKLFILLTIVHNSREVENVRETISLILEFLRKEEFPGTVNAYVCWSKGETLNLRKNLSQNLISCKTTNTNAELEFYGVKNQQIFLVDLDCEGSRDLLKRSESTGFFRKPIRWIILAGQRSASELTEYFFGLDSSVYVIEKTDTEYRIKLPYKFTKNDTQFVENNMATWKHGEWLYYTKVTVPRNRTNLMGSNFRVSYVFENRDSLNHIFDYRFKHIDTASKANFLLVQHLITALNATAAPPIFYKSRGDKLAGSDQYSFMMGDLQRNEIDISGASSIMTFERMKIQDFIQSGFSSKFRFIFRAPLLAYLTNIFTVPFDTYVWYASFILIFVVLLVMYVIVRWEWKVLKTGDNFPMLEDDIFEVFVTELGAITQQGAEREPRSISGRTATLFMFIVFMFLYNAFCANIVAVLQSSSNSIRTVRDLYTTDIALGAEDNVYNRLFFKSVTTHPIQKAIAKEKLSFVSSEDGVRGIKNEFFAFHSEISTIYKIVGETFTQSEICSLREIDFFKFNLPYFSVPRNSTYKELINYTFEKMRESGIINCEQERLFAKKPACSHQGSFGSVGITECYAAYVILVVGIGCSIGVLLLEILWNSKKMFKCRSNFASLFELVN